MRRTTSLCCVLAVVVVSVSLLDVGQAADASGSDPAADELVAWVGANCGVQLDAFSVITPSPGNRSIVAAVDLAEGDTVIRIPKSCLITSSLARSSDVVQRLQSMLRKTESPNHSTLALFMLMDRTDPDSPFQPYYNTLPTSLPNHPLSWLGDDTKMGWLKGSFLEMRMIARRDSRQEDWDMVCAAAPDLCETATYAEWNLFRDLVASRNFELQLDDDQPSEMCMVPLADLANHAIPANTQWGFDVDTDSFYLRTKHAIPAGGNLHDTYGPKSNLRYLLNYGFTVRPNVDTKQVPLDCCAILAAIPDEDDMYDAKMALVQDDVLFDTMAAYWSYPSNNAVLAFLRVAVAEERDLMLINMLVEGGHIDDTRNLPAFLHTNEAAAWDLLAQICELQLAEYTLSLEENVELMASGTVKPGSSRWNALVLVAGEQETLVFLRDLGKEISSMLLLPLEDAEAAYDKAMATSPAYKAGFYSSIVPDMLALRQQLGDLDAMGMGEEGEWEEQEGEEGEEEEDDGHDEL